MRSTRWIFSAAATAMLILLPLACKKPSTPPPPVADQPASPQPPVPVTSPATKPHTHIVTADTVLRRIEDDHLVFDTIDAGAKVELVSAGSEFSRVKSVDGRSGDVPTARLSPNVSLPQAADKAVKNDPGVVPGRAAGARGPLVGPQPPVAASIVGFGKLLYGADAALPPRVVIGMPREDLPPPADVASLARRTSALLKRPIDWRWVAQDADVDDLAGLPVLIITGKGKLEFPEKTKSMLRDYAERGGLIFCNADSGDREARASLMALGLALFPHYEFRSISPSHPLYRMRPYRDDRDDTRSLRGRPSLSGISNGVRELVLFAPVDDPASKWQDESAESYSALDLGVKLLFYARGGWLAHDEKLNRQDLNDKLKKQPAKLTVATWSPAGTLNPEPYAWKRMATVMAADQIALSEQRLKGRDITTLNPEVTPLLHITGIGKFGLDDIECKSIKLFVETGGTLLIDAAGGDEAFAGNSEAWLRKIFRVKKDDFKELQKWDPLLIQFGKPLNHRFDREPSYSAARSTSVRVQTLQDLGRQAVIYCDADLTAGMAGIRTAGIRGYEVETATEFVRHVVLSMVK